MKPYGGGHGRSVDGNVADGVVAESGNGNGNQGTTDFSGRYLP